MRIIWSLGADRELNAIWDYIAVDTPDAADRLCGTIRATVDLAADHARLGRPGKARGTRELVIPGTPYLVIYRVKGMAIDVLHVVHGARDWPPKRRRS